MTGVQPDEGVRAAARQRQAATPDRSVWLSANAGSGKTRVLTERVARLLIDGADPASILCLTYTKAAAAEMQARLVRRLGDWAMRPDAELAATLAALGAPPDTDLFRTRTLFAQAIETPGGLRIQTIHAFCASILRRFPLEAGVNPAFRELDAREAAALRSEILDDLGGSPAAEAVFELGRRVGDSAFARLIDNIVTVRAGFEATDEGANDPSLHAKLDRALTLPPESEAQVLAPLTDPGSRHLLQELRDLAATGSANDQKVARKIADALAASSDTTAGLAPLESALLHGEKVTTAAPFSAKLGKLLTKATMARDPDLVTRAAPLLTAVEAGRPIRLTLDARDRNRALRDFAGAFLAAYAQRKEERGLLDFDDLIGRTRTLLTRSEMAQWVLWRLDGGIDHILVDEAQDTSPAQWSVIERLTEEFHAGQGARPDRTRTLFVVGDPKQSIFSFQGANAAAFGAMQARFAEGLARIGETLDVTELAHSYRSAPAILDTVDAVFRNDAASLGMASRHRAVRPDHPGRVDLWPLIEPTTRETEHRNWTEFEDRTEAHHHEVTLARKVAAEVTSLIRHGTRPVLEDGIWRQTRIDAGDILILVRRRSGVLFTALIQALKAEGVPMAGADRIALGDSLAVRDVEAVLRVLALPQDDLSLAAALRSPLFGWDEGALYRLAQPRPEDATLWSALVRGETGPDGELRRAALDIWRDLRAHTDFLRPHELISRLLVRHGGRARLLARLGPEVDDALDALMAQALVYETQGVPSLTGFLEWRARDDAEIQRRVDGQAGLLRVMTVHGAKGLEAPVVILPDTARSQAPPQSEALLPGPGGPLWAGTGPKAEEVARRLAEKQAADRAERTRLLYVALTRAKSWLIVAGAGQVGEPGESWYADVRAGLSALTGNANPTEFGSGWASLPHVEAAQSARAELAPDATGDLAPLPPPQPLPLIRSATSLGGAKVLRGDPSPPDETAAERARARGTLLHRALELAGSSDDGTLGAVLSLMEEAYALSPGDLPELVATARRLHRSDAMADLIGADVRTEVTVSGMIDGLGSVLGQIDLLKVSPERVTIVDYKTNALVPSSATDVPEGILRQMGAYVALLRPLYPGREIVAEILWTGPATRMALPKPLLDEALARAVTQSA